MMKENRRIVLTKRLLKESILDLLKDHSISKISVKEICENADVNRTTFYNYYTDQYALLNEIEQEALDQTNEFLSKLKNENAQTDLLEIFLNYIKEDRGIFQILLCNNVDNTFQYKLMDITTNQLKAEFNFNISKAEKEYVYQFVIMGCLSMIQKWVSNDFDQPEHELAELIVKLVGYGTDAFRRN